MSLLQDLLKSNSEARAGQHLDNIDSDDDWINVVSVLRARSHFVP